MSVWYLVGAVLVFCATAATIVSGAMAERTKFLSYCIYSAVISAVAGVLVVLVVEFLDFRLHIDDPVGAVGVHCANGVWGTVADGLTSAYADFLPSYPGTIGGENTGKAVDLNGLDYDALQDETV